MVYTLIFASCVNVSVTTSLSVYSLFIHMQLTYMSDEGAFWFSYVFLSLHIFCLKFPVKFVIFNVFHADFLNALIVAK